MAGIRTAHRRRQGALRRIEQLRCLEHRAGERACGSEKHGWADQRAEPIQSAHPRCRAGSRARRDYGVGIIPWSPIGGGVLAGDLHGAGEGRRKGHDYSETVAAKREKYFALCRKIGHEPAVVALAWLLHNPVVTAPIIGPRTLDQLESGVKAIDVALDAETLKELDAIFPGPGNQAPEAYAW